MIRDSKYMGGMRTDSRMRDAMRGDIGSVRIGVACHDNHPYISYPNPTVLRTKLSSPPPDYKRCRYLEEPLRRCPTWRYCTQGRKYAICPGCAFHVQRSALSARPILLTLSRDHRSSSHSSVDHNIVFDYSRDLSFPALRSSD